MNNTSLSVLVLYYNILLSSSFVGYNNTLAFPLCWLIAGMVNPLLSWLSIVVLLYLYLLLMDCIDYSSTLPVGSVYF